MGLAAADLLASRLVGGWRAPYGCRNEGVAELEPVAGVARGRKIRETGAVERRHQEIARTADTVSGEDATCTIRPVRRRRQADQQQAGSCVAEPGHRLAPVL